jgi:hypothetical protein
MRDSTGLLNGEDCPISLDAKGTHLLCSKGSLNFGSDNMQENCKVCPEQAGKTCPLGKEDIARIALAHIPLEGLLLVRGVNSHLRHFVNEEASIRLNSQSSQAKPDLNCRVKAMHGTYAVRRGCRSLKTLLVSAAFLCPELL